MYFRHQTSPADEPNRTVAYVSKVMQKKRIFCAKKVIFWALLIKLNFMFFHVKYQWDLFFCNFKLNFDTSWQKPWKICIIIFFIFFLFFLQHFFHFPSMKVFCSKNYQTITHLHLKYPILSSFNEKIRFWNNFFWAKLSSCWVTVPPSPGWRNMWTAP